MRKEMKWKRKEKKRRKEKEKKNIACFAAPISTGANITQN
jgi:hypothetical protein